METIEHLFCSYSYAWRIGLCFAWWNLVWHYPNQPDLFLDAWMGAPIHGFERKTWTSLLSIVLWSIWRIRNGIQFESFNLNWDFELQQIKIRIGY